MRLLNYLYFDGNCKDALSYYQETFEGKVSELVHYGKSPMPVEETYKERVMHAKLSFGEVIMMLSDAMPNQPVTFGSNLFMSLDFDSLEKMEEVFGKISQQGKVIMPLKDMFWGARFGMLTDKFGVNWMLNFNHEAHKYIQQLTAEHNK
jgi:PhnB protein